MNPPVHSSGEAIALGGAVGRWIKRARDGVVLNLQWRAEQGGGVVALELKQVAGPCAPAQHAGELGLAAERAHQLSWDLGCVEQPVEVSFRLAMNVETQRVMLSANVPLSANEYFDHEIAEWPLDEPPRPPLPTPGVDDSAEVIEALPGTQDLFPFVWMRPLSRAERVDMAQAYVKLVDPSTAQPLYGQLLAVQPPGAAQQKQKIAAEFRSNPAFIGSVSALPAPWPQLLALRALVMAELGWRPLEELTKQAEVVLAEPLRQFLSSNECLTHRLNLWQSLWALALSSTATDAALARDLEALLRCLHYLDFLADGLQALEHAAGREPLLEATPALPDLVAAWPLQGQAGNAGSWELLGVGELELARQHLQGYAAGDLAEVVNLLPGETQELQERHIQTVERQDSTADQTDRQKDQRRLSDTASELADTLREALSTAGMVNNLSKIQPSYSNLNEWLSGTAASGQGAAAWGAERAAELVQRMSEQALQRLNEHQCRQRHEVLREWQERRRLQRIDNRKGARLVGVYRWVDRLVHIRLLPQGRRLVLALAIPKPAAEWVAQVAAQGPVPLVAPVPLPAFSVPDGYTQISPDTYQQWGASYKLNDLPVPPPNQIHLSTQVNRVTVGDTASLVIPTGYQLTSGSALIALPSSAYSLTGMVGSVPLSANSPTPSALLEVTVPAADSGTQVGKPSVQPPTPLPALMTRVPLSDPLLVGTQGPVPVPLSVISDAPLFAVAVELVCDRIKTPTDSLLMHWQLAVYQRLLEGFEACEARYQAALNQRIQLASAQHTGEVQRQVLQQACLALLASSSACSDAERLVGLLDWAQMSWHYELPLTGATGPAVHNPGAPEATARASQRLFEQFLQATEARVLLPVRPDSQTELLYALQWQPKWPAQSMAPSRRDVPVDVSVLPLLEEQAHQETLPMPERGWTLRLPLPQIYLEQGDDLPRTHFHNSVR